MHACISARGMYARTCMHASVYVGVHASCVYVSCAYQQPTPRHPRFCMHARICQVHACIYLCKYGGMHAPSTCVTVAVCTSKYIKYQQKLLETWEPRTVYNKPLKMKPPKPRGLGGRRQVPRSGRATAQSAKQAQSRTCTQTRLPDSPPGFGFRVSRLACRAFRM